MRIRLLAVVVMVVFVASGTATAQLYTQNFDIDDTANWTLSANQGFGTSPSDGIGDPDASADYFFDYSTVGIPSAPNSTGGTTRGMKIQANLISGIFGGASASPNGKAFSGDYKVNFDLWANYVGDPVNGLNPGGVGQTNMSTFGILTDGLTGVVPGVVDGVWFGATAEGGSSVDFRAYSTEREISYQIPTVATVLDGLGQPVDLHATHFAKSRNNSPGPADFNDDGIMDAADYVVWRNNVGFTDTVIVPVARGNADFDMDVDQADYDVWRSLYGSKGLYRDNFGGVAAPAAQLALYPQQTGTTPLGSIGMEWHDVEISKVGNLVTWKIDGVTLITIDMTNFTVQPDGSNIFFGHSDINAGSSAEPDRFALQFSLFDNVRVTAIPPAIGSSVGSVPEPSTIFLVGLGLLAIGTLRNRRG